MNRKDFAHQAKGWQYHDVNSWMGVKPEKMLVDNRIAPHGRVEKACMGNDVKTEQDQGACQHRCGEHHKDAGAEHGPAVHG
jgi:hypothetical protein